ncbi:MAG: riboflavin synthase [Selenomonadaceae bacterium]|nr:riboflavin synthase [Selenomonadaceae bacterium]
MFTGIIEEVGSFRGMAGGCISISCSKVLEDVSIGDSIAVNGICLTVTRFDARHFEADVMPETLRRTSLEGLREGAVLNLERAVTPATRMGGHFVSGHIDGVGIVENMKQEGNAILLSLEADERLLRYIVEKGSVALDGISLTVVSVEEGRFTVSLIPHTRDNTNLREKMKGQPVNIETDILGKYVEKMLLNVEKQRDLKNDSRLTREFLLENGF